MAEEAAQVSSAGLSPRESGKRYEGGAPVLQPECLTDASEVYERSGEATKAKGRGSRIRDVKMRLNTGEAAASNMQKYWK